MTTSSHNFVLTDSLMEKLVAHKIATMEIKTLIELQDGDMKISCYEVKDGTQMRILQVMRYKNHLDVVENDEIVMTISQSAKPFFFSEDLIRTIVFGR